MPGITLNFISFEEKKNFFSFDIQSNPERKHFHVSILQMELRT